MNGLQHNLLEKMKGKFIANVKKKLIVLWINSIIIIAACCVGYYFLDYAPVRICLTIIGILTLGFPGLGTIAYFLYKSLYFNNL